MISAQELEKIRVANFSISTSLLINAAREKGLQCDFLPERAFSLSNATTSHYFKGTSFPCNSMVASSLSCNKYFLRKVLKGHGIPVPKTLRLSYPSQWQKVITSTLRFPLAVKPSSASHAHGSTMNILTEDELRRAVRRAFDYMKKNKAGKRVLVEEYFAAEDLRFFVIGKRVVSVLQREPAYIIGDGKNTIRKLIANFNREWRSSIKYDLPLCPIPIDTETARRLHRQGKTLNSIPAHEEKVMLRWNANVSTGGRAIDVTDIVHPNMKKLAIIIAGIAKLEITGVDILCKDITSGDTSSANVRVLETNDSPGIDIHHFPFTGKGENISAMILDHVFL
jgi:cyanophycin synthetase